MNRITRTPLLPLQVLWVVLALAAGPTAADALDDRSTPVVAVLAAVSWGAWAAAVVALLVPRTLSLTVMRMVVPAAWVATVAAVAAGTDTTALDGITLAAATAALVVTMAPWVTDAFVDGSSYGPEQRFALRTPLLVSLVAVPTWALGVAGALAGPLLLAACQWLPGVGALVVGAGAAVVAARSLHQLSRRWLVLVPTGMVLHDPLTMPEPQLFLRQTMRHLGPATAGVPDDALLSEDLTGGASGLVIELVLSERVDLLVNQGRRATDVRPVDRVLFSPGRPGALLRAARDRRLPVG